jgi:Uma2 family endonuclease
MVDVVARPEGVARPAPEADADEYLEWLRELVSPDRAELLDGDLVVSGAPDPEHQDAGGRLFAWLLAWADASGLARVWPAPVAVKLAVGERDVQPDVVLLRRDNPRARLVPRQPRGRSRRARRGYVAGPPDLLVEVVSPGSAPRDREWKRDVYARAGVAHSWVLDFEARTATGFAAPAAGRYARATAAPWAALRWRPEAGDRWGDSPTFPTVDAARR